MFRGIAAVCFLALLVSPFATASRALKQGQTATFCRADSDAILRLSDGTGQARGSANCKAESDARNDIRRVVRDFIESVAADENKACVEATANAVVEGVAEAVAKVFVSVSNTVDIQGTGTACASGFAEGDAFAIAMVDVFVEVSLVAVKDEYGEAVSNKVKNSLDKATNTATGKAVGEAATAVISSAWASASNQVCTNKKPVSGFDEASAVQVKQAIAFMFAEVILTVCEEAGADLEELKEWESGLADSNSFVDGSVQQVTVKDQTTGGGQTGADDPKECTGLKKSICCRDSQKQQDTCDCGVGCTLETLLDRDSSIIFPSNAKVWKDVATEEPCFCLASGK